MNYLTKLSSLLILFIMINACTNLQNNLEVTVIESNSAGLKLSEVVNLSTNRAVDTINIRVVPAKQFQTITGFGGSFTEASAYLLNQLSEAKRRAVLEAYFGDTGARYSLTRTHMNSCDFSLGNYSYAPVEDDLALEHFSIKEDLDDIVPMIKDAMSISKEGFKIIASPWTAPPWMKDNKSYVGGKLLPEYYDTWALFFSKYIDAYKEQGIDIWGFTVENEPMGNDNNWESMHFSPAEMTAFVENHLGPKLAADGKATINILGFDQNRGDVKEWVDEMFKTEAGRKYFDGTAVHWYASTFEVFPDELQYAHHKAPDKHLIQSEACVDAEVPKWQNDAWYWSKEATDWGWDWAPEKDKHMHPKYVPVYRYARDIIGCLNNWVDGWVDWNMVLNRQGGPNWFKNWCTAPVIVDPAQDAVYFTPLYYTLSHFSRFIRPGGKRIGIELSTNDVLATAVQNPDGTVAIVILNPGLESKNLSIIIGDKQTLVPINKEAIQTILINNHTK